MKKYYPKINSKLLIQKSCEEVNATDDYQEIDERNANYDATVVGHQHLVNRYQHEVNK